MNKKKYLRHIKAHAKLPSSLQQPDVSKDSIKFPQTQKCYPFPAEHHQQQPSESTCCRAHLYRDSSYGTGHTQQQLGPAGAAACPGGAFALLLHTPTLGCAPRNHANLTGHEVREGQTDRGIKGSLLGAPTTAPFFVRATNTAMSLLAETQGAWQQKEHLLQPFHTWWCTL